MTLRRYQLVRLQAELLEAGIQTQALTAEDDLVFEVLTDGTKRELPPEADAVIAAHDPTPEPVVTRDDRLLAAVDQAKDAVTTSGQFTPQQAAVLSAVFDGLGAAITGGGG